MSVQGVTALIAGITGLATAITALLHSISTRKITKNAVPPKG
jgi:hypothetical protein